MNINPRCVYRLTEPKFSTNKYWSLQAYSNDQGAWTHITFFSNHQILDAETRYNETVQHVNFSSAYDDFSFNNLIELDRIVYGTPHQEIIEMLDEVCSILNVKLNNRS